MFIGREKELERLNKIYSANTFHTPVMKYLMNISNRAEWVSVADRLRISE